jgi:hypothetical protein
MNFYQTTRRHISEDSDYCTYLIVECVLSQELHGLQMRVELVYNGERLPQQMLWEQERGGVLSDGVGSHIAF